MTLAELADALFPGGHALDTDAFGVTSGRATTKAGMLVGVVGMSDGKPVGVDAAIRLSGVVLAHAERAPPAPLVVLVDTQSQSMTRRDELLGLADYLAHLAKSFALASSRGHRTVGILYGGAAAGAFIATALSTDILIAVPGAAPSVMDLPSIARVTKLPLDRLEGLAKTTPIFAPGIEPLAATGAVTETWDDDRGRYADALDRVLVADAVGEDRRDRLGSERGGRTKAAEVAARVRAEARPGG